MEFYCSTEKGHAQVSTIGHHIEDVMQKLKKAFKFILCLSLLKIPIPWLDFT